MLLRGGATVGNTRFQSIRLCDFLKSQIYGLGTSFENSRIRHDTFQCGDFAILSSKKYKRLDILINAAQTVRRPAGFYTHLMENEERSIASTTGTGIITGSYELSG
jgi:hypothetical protein